MNKLIVFVLLYQFDVLVSSKKYNL